MNQTTTDGGVIVVNTGGSVSLTNSTISSADGNRLVYGQSNDMNTVSLVNVNLDQAKNQVIGRNDAIQYTCTLNLSEGTNLDGYAVVGHAGSMTNVTIATGASWNVTQDSNLGLGTLSLAGDSVISFVTDSGDFTNINAAAVMLAENSILQLDRQSSTFEVGDMVTLFTGAAGDAFTNLGAHLMTSDGYSLLYIDHDNGSFEITAIVIPEPSAAAFGLLGLGLLARRRRRS